VLDDRHDDDDGAVGGEDAGGEPGRGRRHPDADHRVVRHGGGRRLLGGRTPSAGGQRESERAGTDEGRTT
jgi:hypothetical protein